jgi:hypothetical protein
MKQYLLSIYQPEGEPDPEVMERVMRDLDVLKKDMKAAGAWVFSGPLHDPSTSTVLRATGSGAADEVLVTDGPFIEAKEFLGGFDIIQAPDLDAALEWGRRLARAVTGLAVEVRPFQ